jgi:hypothetical protein
VTASGKSEKLMKEIGNYPAFGEVHPRGISATGAGLFAEPAGRSGRRRGEDVARGGGGGNVHKKVWKKEVS